jgi:cytochrome c oxidase cbb3-type subunit 3
MLLMAAARRPKSYDDYWLHGGGIKDIFKTITYGWPDKGMKSWKDDYSAFTDTADSKLCAIACMEPKPATPKEPQGTLYKASDAPAADSSAKDSSSSHSRTTAFVK